MGETFSKKEKQKKNQLKKKEKEQRKAERKANSKPGKSLEEMMAYVDENGNISAAPPDPNKKVAVHESDVVIGSRNTEAFESNPVRKGRVTYFNNEKGYGFIKDLKTQQSVFVHNNALTTPLKENDLVSFQTQTTVRGLSAMNVAKT
jgi:cold shock CspA family protein